MGSEAAIIITPTLSPSRLVAHDDERLPRRALDVELRNLPGGPVIPRCVHRAAGIPHVQGERAVSEAGKTPAILMPALVRCPERTHALSCQVCELFEQVVIHWSPAHDAHHPTHAVPHPSNRIKARAYVGQAWDGCHRSILLSRTTRQWKVRHSASAARDI